MTVSSVGLFPLALTIGTGADGAQTLALTLAVATPTSTVTGMAHLTQAISPPLNETVAVAGSYTQLTIIPVSASHLLMTLHSVAGMPLTVRILFSLDWTPISASYQYEIDGVWHSVDNAPVHLTLPLEPGPVIPPALRTGPVVLYGGAMQQAQSSGDLAAMKVLASEAETQLAKKDDLSTALQAAKAVLGPQG